MKKVALSLMLVFLLVGAGPALAGTEAGDTELGVQLGYDNISISNDVDEDWDVFTVAGKVNYFVTDALSLGLSVMGEYYSYDDSDETMLFVEFEPNYHFSTGSSVVPYVGAHAGFVFWEFEDEDDTVFTYGGQIGVKSFFAENAAIDIQLRYTRYEPDVEDADIEIDQISGLVGLNIYF
jgi:hypothetical protein